MDRGNEREMQKELFFKKRVKKVTKAKPISSDTKPAKELSKKEFKEKITSEKLRGTLDMSSSLYESTDFLLPHDDDINKRKITYFGVRFEWRVLRL